MIQIQSSEMVQRIASIWKRFNLALDIPTIDRQHLWLIAVIVYLEGLLERQAIEGGQDLDSAFSAALTEAMDYTLQHFTLEEELLEKTGYPELRQHRFQHMRFIGGLKLRAREHMTATDQAEASKKLLQRLKHWLFHHILSEDRKYREFVAASGFDAERLCAAISERSGGPDERQLELYAMLDRVAEPEEEDVDQRVLDAVSEIWHKYRLKTGIAVIDIQHLWLIRQVVELDWLNKRQLSHSVSDEALNERFNKTITGAIGYIQEHFKTEEAIMRHFEFPGFANHLRQHRHFVEFINERNRQNKAGDHQAMANLLQDLKEWLLSHIAIEDKRLHYFFRKRLPELNEFVAEQIRKKEIVVRQNHMALYRPIVLYEVNAAH